MSILREVFEVARYTPSNCNTQPWLAAVVGGEMLNALAEAFVEHATRSRYLPDIPYAGSYDGIYRSRQVEAARLRYESIGLRRDDAAGRLEADLANFTFHGAPHAVFLFYPSWGGVREAADLGQYAQTLMLAMTAYGIASVPQTALGMYGELVRERLSIEDKYILLFGISFGFEDGEAPSTDLRFKTGRAPLDETVRFYL